MSLAWTIYSLAKNQEVQNKLYEEIKEINEKKLSISDSIKEGKYLDCVIKESLRLNLGTNFSRLIEEDCVISGLKIPAGTELFLEIFNVHLDKENWINAKCFQPERFMEVLNEENVFKFIPFSAGPRNCIGKKFAMTELKIAVYYLILNFDIKIVKEITDELKIHIYIGKKTEFSFTRRS